MTVYVDDVRYRFGRTIMCHMWADTLDELLSMADRIGVARKRLQKPPKADWVHFDIAVSRKARAVALGAVLTDMFGPAEHVARRTGNLRMVGTIVDLRRRRGLPINGILAAPEPMPHSGKRVG
jgi:hypothetical protein